MRKFFTFFLILFCTAFGSQPIHAAPPDSLLISRKSSVYFYFGGNVGLSSAQTKHNTTTLSGAYASELARGGVMIGFAFTHQFSKNAGYIIKIDRIAYQISYQGPMENFSIEKMYPDFYVSGGIKGSYRNRSVQYNIHSGLFYRISVRKWFIQPQLMLGVNTTHPFAGSYFLKQKESNYTKVLNYIPETSLNFMGNGGIMIGFRWKMSRGTNAGFSLTNSIRYSRLGVRYEIESQDVLNQTTKINYEGIERIWMRDTVFGFHYEF